MKEGSKSFPTPEEIERDRILKLQPLVDDLMRYVITYLHQNFEGTPLQIREYGEYSRAVWNIVVDEARKAGWEVEFKMGDADCDSWIFSGKSTVNVPHQDVCGF